MNKYLFLDFDGVLSVNTEPAFSKALYFSNAVKKLDNLFIVFSTSWREYSSLEKLKSYLPEDIHHKCIGKTPFLKNCYSHVRYKEIMLYNQEHNITDLQWIALDDMKSIFPPECKNLILTNPKFGFSEIEAIKIKNFYNQIPTHDKLI